MLLDKVLEYLRVRPGGVYLDGTLGGAGYTRAIAEHLTEGGRVIALDQDERALARARERLAGLSEGRVRLVHANFKDAAQVLDAEGTQEIDGAVLDLGLSSEQLDDPARGFSFESAAPPDMRMDVSQRETAADLVNQLSESELSRIIQEYGEEPKARALARRIVAARPITSARQLADLAKGLYPGRSRVHPATRLFQALRIAVNDELGALDAALRDLPERLAPGGRLAIVSFHSLEDRRVKQCFSKLAQVPKDPVTGQDLEAPGFRVVTRKPITPGEEETERNPRARSAKLRVLERL